MWSFKTIKNLFKILLSNAFVCYVSCSSILFSLTGSLPAHPQSCFASLAPLPLLTSFQHTILSLMHRQSVLPCVPWSSQIPLNWWCSHSPALSHKAACKRCSRNLCCLTKPRSASNLGSMILYTYHHSTKPYQKYHKLVSINIVANVQHE